MTSHAASPNDWLLRLLVQKNLLSSEDADRFRRPNAPLDALARREGLSREKIAQAVAGQYGIKTAVPDPRRVDKMATGLVPEPLCQKHRLIPYRLDGESLEVLMANPLDIMALDAVAAVSGRRPVPLFAFPEEIKDLSDAVHSSDTVVFDLLKKMPDAPSVEIVSDRKGDKANAVDISMPVVKLADAIIAQAVRAGASDIHIEHDERASHVRYRVDGVLRTALSMPKYIGEGPLVSRVKIMAELDVADRRHPQDGRAKLRVGSDEIGLRVSTLPTAFGEKAVLRILDQNQAEIPLSALGFRPEILERLTRLSESNQGLLLVTGPTGSGKTTTLYSILHKLKSPDINIVTVEDPVEYRLAGINQVQVNEKGGLTFAAVLRSVLRQDPDVVLVGEIRDRETAEIAFQAAQTGHMVFSTLHTNDALSSVSRLLDIGVERYKMTAALVGITAQRLARRVCADCAKPETLDHPVAARLKERGLPATHARGAGCDACGFTGMRGRVALTELLDLSDQKARDLLNSGADEARFRGEALSKRWLLTLEEDALWHLSQGHIPLNEALPYVSSSAPAAAPAPAEPARSRAAVPPAGKRAVLVVDDSADNRVLARQVLEKAGFDVREADNGVTALNEIARERPDLVLLDIMMPGMDGFAVLKRLRGELGLTDLPVVVLTAIGESESQAVTLDMGADDYLTKPFHHKVLAARVQALFRRMDLWKDESERRAA